MRILDSERPIWRALRQYLFLTTIMGFVFGTATQLWGQPSVVINRLSPSYVAAGSGGFTLTVTGSGFLGGAAGSGILWNYSPVPTTILSNTMATAVIPASSVATATVAQVNFLWNIAGTTPIYSNYLEFDVLAPLTSLSPAVRPRGLGGFELLVNGNFSNFSIPVVTWNSMPRATTVVSPTQLSATISDFDVASVGTATIQVLETGDNLAIKSTTLTFTIDPSLSLTQIDPAQVTLNSGSFNLVVTGTGFRSEYSSTIYWNRTRLNTTFLSPTQLSAVVPASELTTLGPANITVVNLIFKITSNAVVFQVTAPTPAPVISSLNPSFVVAGKGPVNLVVNGSNFIPPTAGPTGGTLAGSTVLWNATSLSTAYVSSTQLAVVIPADFVAVAGTAEITISNEAQYGAVSTPATFTINNPVPVISAISPNAMPPGSAGFVLTITGSDFLRDSVVQWNGSSRPTSQVSATQLTAQISAADVASTGTAQVTVFNPSPGGGVSNAVAFTILPPLQITSSATLPSGMAGMVYSASLSATGGLAPYQWRVVEGNLPSGLTLSSGGVISGTPSGSGNFSVQIGVTDALKNSVSQLFAGSIRPALSPVTILGIPDLVISGQQPSVSLQLSAPYPATLTGQLVLTFTPNPASNVDDPAIQFVTGGRTVSFTIPANNTQAVFSNNSTSVLMQTGTVAGTITLRVSMQLDGNNLTLSPDPTQNLVIALLPPTIVSTTITNKTANGFEIQVIGYANSRNVRQAQFHFNPTSNSNLQTVTLTSDLSGIFNAWYSSADSAQFGSQFKLVIPFTVTGTTGDISSVIVWLINDQGWSSPMSVSMGAGQ
jgi:hypothetical protein